MNRNERFILKLLIGFVLVLTGVRVWSPEVSWLDQDYRSIEVTGKESCILCHSMEVGFSKFHDPRNIGCTSCHLGNPESLNSDVAHEGMVVVPGNLETADKTCGTCHKDAVDKIKSSLMTTNSGIVAVDKFIFRESDSLDHHFDIREIGHSAADSHLRNLCANCHLGAEKTSYGPIDQLSRGGGCLACHLNYSEAGADQLQKYLSSGKKVLPEIHPSVDIKISDEHCFGCHSRSSRISSNYMGWHETLLDSIPLHDFAMYKEFDDGRIYSRQEEDVHYQAGLSCVDCHISAGVMGDGKRYAHAEEAVKISCEDCHVKEQPELLGEKMLPQESLRLRNLHNYRHEASSTLITKNGEYLVDNVFMGTGDTLLLIRKRDQQLLPISRQSSICSNDSSHKNLSCSSCHTSWVPRCIGCHNTYEDNAEMAYDLLDKTPSPGGWAEHVFEFGMGLPSIGVREEGGHVKFEPAIPGMILTIDGSVYNKNSEPIFERLYAPNSPHTITKDVRSCKSCHSDPLTLGYGSGVLSLEVSVNKAYWLFIPDYEKNPNDGLPEDAWIPFLERSTASKQSTRSNFRPLSISEQKKILRVGACLTCHEEDSDLMRKSLEIGIEPLHLMMSESCKDPFK